MASNTTTLPSWASSVVFPDDRAKITKSLNVLRRKLKEVTPQWWQLGLQLRQHPAPLDELKSHTEKDSVQHKFERMLEYWLKKGKDEHRTWGVLAQAVEDSGNRALSKQIRALDYYQEYSRVQEGLVDLTDLLQQLAPRWKTLAINLYIPLWISEMIDDKLSPEDCLVKALEKWITDSDDDEEPTLEVLYNALESHAVANRALAIKILKDVEVLELLTVSKKEKDQESVKKKLDSYIAMLRKRIEDIDAALANLPEPSTKDPAEKKSTEKQLENPIKDLQGRETTEKKSTEKPPENPIKDLQGKETTEKKSTEKPPENPIKDLQGKETTEKKSTEKPPENPIKDLQGKETIDAEDENPEAAEAEEEEKMDTD